VPLWKVFSSKRLERLEPLDRARDRHFERLEPAQRGPFIRAVFILTMQNGFYFADSVEYSAAAVNLLANGDFGEKYTRPPVYPVFLAGIYALAGTQ